jgi:hypothetical protein
VPFNQNRHVMDFLGGKCGTSVRADGYANLGSVPCADRGVVVTGRL